MAANLTDLCVLLVDSDPSCSKKTLEILLDAGYRVVMVSRGDEALSTLRHKKRRVDLVVISTKLPDMCAFKLVERLDTEFNIAVVMTCDHLHWVPTTLRALSRGASFCLTYPPPVRQVKLLWKFTAVGKREQLRQASRSLATGDSS